MTPVLAITLNVTAVMLGVGLILGLIRLVRGPSLPDRVVALDVIATIITGAIVLYAIATDQSVYLRAAIVLALVSFIGTVAFAYFVEKGGTP